MTLKSFCKVNIATNVRYTVFNESGEYVESFWERMCARDTAGTIKRLSYANRGARVKYVSVWTPEPNALDVTIVVK